MAIKKGDFERYVLNKRLPTRGDTLRKTKKTQQKTKK